MNRPSNFIDLTGKRFGRLTVREFVPKNSKSYWNCLCDCGEVKTVSGTSLKNGSVRSCGCLRKEVTSKRRTTHGLSKSPEYRVWAAMKRRCNLPTDSAYPKYGARGVRVCAEWETFANFYADMGPKPTPQHSIDRIDYRGNYEPKNCRWVDVFTQANNKSNNKHLTVLVGGEEVTRTVPEWSRVSGVGYYTIRARLKKGVDPYKAVFTPSSPFAKF